MIPKKLQNFLPDAVGKFGDYPAIISSTTELTYREYFKNTLNTAYNLKKNGFRNSEIVAIIATPGPEYLILLQALWYQGIIALPLNTHWPASLLDKQLGKLGVQKVVVKKGLGNLPSSKKVKVFNLQSIVELDVLDFSQNKPKEFGYDEEQPATIIFTSGSSGEPKAAMHTLGNHYYNALGSNQNIPVQLEDCWLLSLPIYHVGGLAILFRAVLGGGAVVIPDQTSDLESSITKFKPSHISLVPTQLYRLLQKNEIIEELGRMKAILLGGGPIPDSLIRQSLDIGLPTHTSYGSTEMASQVTTTGMGDSPEKLRTSGKLLPHRELQISSEGEILVKGRTLFRGYSDGNQLSKARDNQGWFHSSDMGYLDDDGYLTVTGRLDNLFISGGENIQPEEIENAILQIVGVLNAVVVPVKDEEFGERPAAFVKTEKGRTDFTKIKRYLEKELPCFKVPDYFLPWPKDFLDEGMKLNRKSLIIYAEKILNDQLRVSKD
jgi:O-succinylbenzoic acid--CoA ligase